MLAMQSCSRYILSFAAAAIVFTSGTEAAVIARRADNGGGGGNSLAIWVRVPPWLTTHMFLTAAYRYQSSLLASLSYLHASLNSVDERDSPNQVLL